MKRFPLTDKQHGAECEMWLVSLEAFLFACNVGAGLQAAEGLRWNPLQMLSCIILISHKTFLVLIFLLQIENGALKPDLALDLGCLLFHAHQLLPCKVGKYLSW